MQRYRQLNWRLAACAGITLLVSAGALSATEPCGDFAECKALIEINATDGDIGFQFLMDGEDLKAGRLRGPHRRMIFNERARGPLRRQKLTETFVESGEPLCWDDPEADEEEVIVTLEEFLNRWPDGTYRFAGRSDHGERLHGGTQLTYELPAAPANLEFDGGVVSWSPGDDLGKCATFGELAELVAAGILPMHPVDVTVDAWEVVLEPDVEDGDPTGELVFSVRVPSDVTPTQVTVPVDYLASLPADTPVKVELGAIGGEDNATFTEVAGFCVNEVEGCEEE